MVKKIALMAGVATLLFAGNVQAMEAADAQKLISEHVSAWLNDPIVTQAIIAQNEKTSSLSEEEIIALDQRWRNDDTSLIDPILNNALSEYLSGVVEQGEGLYSEIFVMDAKGLNVGQSTKTSDYWQGDEAKWQKTFLVGADALHLSDVEFDESTQTYQIQISLPVLDSGQPIGAVTIGVDAEMVE